MTVTRRQVLVGALTTGFLAACSAARPDGTPSASTAAPASPASASPTTSAPPTTSPSAGGAALPSVHPWTARAGEVDPVVKRRATSLVEAVGTWTGSQGDAASARRRAQAAGHDPALVAGLAPLLGGGSDAVVSVRDAQYGGILSSSSSVLVVVDQWRITSSGTVSSGGTTLDVRLTKGSSGWRVVEVLPATPAVLGAPSATARRVLSDDRIRLPYAAHRDVAGGSIHDSVLAVLLALAQTAVVDVSVLRSGHPLHVFGTSRTSDHPKGRAVDVWALDGRPLVEPGNHALAARAMRDAVRRGAYNVGGPQLLPGPQYFSDRTHQDHIHLGFRA